MDAAVRPSGNQETQTQAKQLVLAAESLGEQGPDPAGGCREHHHP